MSKRDQTYKQMLISKAFYAKVAKWSCEDWIERINTIEDPQQRDRVATRVWWEMSQRRDDLLPIKAMALEFIRSNDVQEFPEGQLKAGLIKVGFPEHVAADLGREKIKWKTMHAARQRQVSERNGKTFFREPIKEINKCRNETEPTTS